MIKRRAHPGSLSEDRLRHEIERWRERNLRGAFHFRARSAMAFRESFPFSFNFLAMASWMPVSTIRLSEGTQIGGWVCLDVGVGEVAHVRLVWLGAPGSRPLRSG
jgi:hypothetical protein